MAREARFLDDEGEEAKEGRGGGRTKRGTGHKHPGVGEEWGLDRLTRQLQAGPPATTVTGAPQRTLSGVPLLLL